MKRSLRQYTQLLLLPVLAVGLVLAGCDSNGGMDAPDSEDDDDLAIQGSFPDPSSDNGYAEEVAVNLQSAGIGVRLENAASTSELNEIYTSPNDDTPIRRISGSDLTFDQGTYGELANGGVNLSAAISKDNLLRSDQLAKEDTDQEGQLRSADQLISYYLDEATHTSPNGVDFSQLSEKGVAGAISFHEGAEILNDFVGEDISSDQAEEKWNEAFGHFGAPRDFRAFLDYNGDGGLVGGASFQDADGSGGIDLISEAVYIWAGYAAERAAAAESTGNPNDFARRAFEAFRQGREDIDDGNLDELGDHAETALDAWEATVAVNVIHYTNSMKSDMENLGESDEITQSELGSDSRGESSGFEDHWAEAKIFAWTLQFNDTSELTNSKLKDIHDQIRSAPPHGEGVTKSDYVDVLNSVQSTIQDAYDLENANVQAW